MKLKKMLLALPFALSLSFSAHANLITNGDFETGDLTGWGVSGLTQVYSTIGHNSNYGNGFDTTIGGTIQQTLSGLTVGKTYKLDYWLRNDNFGTGSSYNFQASWAGSVISGSEVGNVAAFAYTLQSFNLIAFSNSAVLAFSGTSQGAFYLDDVSLDEVTTPPVPEAPEWLLTLSGLSALAFAKKRKAA
ncbi:MAG: hypothetical protein NTV43_13745 [Methylococcales bacterium]|nr:hypothetical protein [Methylococcales bacterium]